MSKKSRKLVTVKADDADRKLYDSKPENTGVCIGVTYLDDKIHGLVELHDAAKGDPRYVKELSRFISSAKDIGDMNEFVTKYTAKRHNKNQDAASNQKVEQLNRDYRLQIGHLIHLHCKSGGSGSFVIHGFQVDSLFEIVWLDPLHSVHKM